MLKRSYFSIIIKSLFVISFIFLLLGFYFFYNQTSETIVGNVVYSVVDGSSSCSGLAPSCTSQFGVCVDQVQLCVSQEWVDCDVFGYSLTELCGDGLDNNCDGEVDEDSCVFDVVPLAPSDLVGGFS